MHRIAEGAGQGDLHLRGSVPSELAAPLSGPQEGAFLLQPVLGSAGFYALPLTVPELSLEPKSLIKA